MSYFKFSEDDVFINTIVGYPQYSFYIYSASVFLNNMPQEPGDRHNVAGTNVKGVPNGYISLYEYNIDRPTSGVGSGRIYPFVYKDGKRNSFKNITEADYNGKYSVGDIVTSSYNMSASITRNYFAASGARAGRAAVGCGAS